MSLGRAMLRGSLWATLDGFGSEIANLLIFLALVRLLGPEAYGLVAIAMIFIAITSDLVGYSVSRVLVQRSELTERLCQTVFLLILGLAGSSALILILCASPIARVFDTPDLAPILRCLSLSLFLQAIGAVPLALLTRDLRFDSIAKRSFAMIVSGGVIGIGLAWAGYGAWALVGQILTQAAVSAALLFGASGFRPTGRGSRDDLRAILGYALNVVGNRIVIQMDERAPQFVIGLTLGPAAVGAYNVAMRLVDILIRMFVVPVNQVAFPSIARVQSDPTQVRGILETGIVASGLISVPAFLGTIVIAPDLLPLALGDSWVAATPVLQLLAFRGLFWPVILYGTTLLYGIGRPGDLLRLNAFDLAANLIVLACATPFGMGAVAAASSARIVLVRWPLMGGTIARLADLSLRRQAVLMGPALMAGTLMALVVVGVRAQATGALDGPFLVAVLIAAGALSYPVLALLFRPGLKSEVGTLLQQFRQRAA